MAKVKAQRLAFLQIVEVFSKHALAQQIVDFNHNLALQRFANDEVDFPIRRVGEKVEISDMPFRGGIPDKADAFADRRVVTTIVCGQNQADFRIAFVLVPEDVNLMAKIVYDPSLGRLKLP